MAALERMAALTNASEEYAASERYYERAVSLEPKNAGSGSRRGWNALSALAPSGWRGPASSALAGSARGSVRRAPGRPGGTTPPAIPRRP